MPTLAAYPGMMQHSRKRGGLRVCRAALMAANNCGGGCRKRRPSRYRRLLRQLLKDIAEHVHAETIGHPGETAQPSPSIAGLRCERRITRVTARAASPGTRHSVPPGGIEPPTHGLGNRCSSPLSYGGDAAEDIKQPSSESSIQHAGPASNVRRRPRAHGGRLDVDRSRTYDQTSPVIGSAVAALFA
jgi:hypothetical protein